MSSVIRRFVATAVLLTLLLAFPASVGATITGGCTGTGTATSGGVDLTTATEWHVQSTDVGGGSGQGPSAKSASVGAYALGILIPIASGTSEDGETSGSVQGVSVSLFAALGKRFVVSGSADNGCSGQIEIIIDDVNPLLTVLGGGGVAAAVIGLLAVLLMTRGGSGILKRLFDALFGAIGGIGAALALEQFDVIDPTEIIGLLIVLIAAAIGFLTTGIFGRGSDDAAPPQRPAWEGATPVGGSATGNVGQGSGPMGASGQPPAPPADPASPPTETYPGGGVGGGGPA